MTENTDKLAFRKIFKWGIHNQFLKGSQEVGGKCLDFKVDFMEGKYHVLPQKNGLWRQTLCSTLTSHIYIYIYMNCLAFGRQNPGSIDIAIPMAPKHWDQVSAGTNPQVWCFVSSWSVEHLSAWPWVGTTPLSYRWGNQGKTSHGSTLLVGKVAIPWQARPFGCFIRWLLEPQCKPGSWPGWIL